MKLLLGLLFVYMLIGSIFFALTEGRKKKWHKRIYRSSLFMVASILTFIY